MVRIAGINLPKGKRVEVALGYLYGIGPSLGLQICRQCKVNPDAKTEDLTPDEENRLREAVAKYPVEGDLRRSVSGNIKRLQDIGTYRGFRHRRRLPVRGQRTKTNARTKRGKRVTMGSGRAKESKT